MKPSVIVGFFLMFGGGMAIPIIPLYFATDILHIYVSQDVRVLLLIFSLIFLFVGMVVGIILLNRASRSDRLKWQKETREKINKWKSNGYNVDEVDEKLREIE